MGGSNKAYEKRVTPSETAAASDRTTASQSPAHRDAVGESDLSDNADMVPHCARMWP